MNIERNFDTKIAVERQRSFKDFTVEDILSFLNRFRRAESVDPLHKWICTYNNYRMRSSPFFKWLYYLDIEPNTRQKTACNRVSLKEEW